VGVHVLGADGAKRVVLSILHQRQFAGVEYHAHLCGKTLNAKEGEMEGLIKER
jgi:hypothetical protein